MTDTIEKIAGEMKAWDFLSDPISRADLHDWADRLLALRGEAVAFAIALPTGEASALGWMDMKMHESVEKFLILSPGCSLIYAYRHPSPPISEAVREAVADIDGAAYRKLWEIGPSWQTIRAFLREQGLK